MLDASKRALDVDRSLRRWRRARALDRLLDIAVLPCALRGRRYVQYRTRQRRRVAVLTVLRAANEPTWRLAERELRAGRHDVSVGISAVNGAGKFANLNRLLNDYSLSEYDWLLLIDDDVVLPTRFLDTFLTVAEHFRLSIAQPAHCAVSHASWPVTRRAPFAIARATNFVEIGPVTALHRETFATLTPFPADGMGYGLDFEWARTAGERRWTVGIVDVTPVVHLIPAGTTYSAARAAESMPAGLYREPRTDVTFRSWDHGFQQHDS